MESTFSHSMIEKGGVGKLKSKLNNSYIILITNQIELNNCKYVDKVIESPLQVHHVISALKEYYSEAEMPELVEEGEPVDGEQQGHF